MGIKDHIIDTYILHSEEFQLEARRFVHSNACKKGEPNLTSKHFAEWIQSKYGVGICERTARRWLNKLKFSQMQHQKGVYFDGMMLYCTEIPFLLSLMNRTKINHV